MLLAIDIGNTNIVLGLFDGDKLSNSWRIKSDAADTADELWIKISALLADEVITGIALCSTVPALLREMRILISRYFASIKSVIVEPGIKTGTPLLVDNPKEIGADRIVNTLAAHTIYGKNSDGNNGNGNNGNGKNSGAIVVDFGTSTNLDVVSPNGEFLGGALAAGIEISVEALANRAAQLRRVELVKPKSVIGKNTVEALQSGTIYGFAGQVDGLVSRIKAELRNSYPQMEGIDVIATGGLAPLVFGVAKEIEFFEPDLTLLGLKFIFERNA
jgi:type III pantothenate kinase